VWTTGNQAWDRLVTASPAGSSAVITFDKPIKFDYRHSLVNERNPSNTAYFGKKLVLEYGGPGNLWGFPWQELPNGRWVSPATLKDAVLLTDFDGVDYITKGVQLEQILQASNPLDLNDLTACNALDANAADVLALPRPADIGDVTITVADMPIVSAPPAVIDGELQYFTFNPRECGDFSLWPCV